MLKSNTRYAIIALVIVSVVSVGISGTTVAQSDSAEIFETSTEYPASEDSQAIHITLTVSPPDEQVTNVSLEFQNSKEAYIDFESFSVTLEPSGATEIDESLQLERGDKIKSFFIESLRSDETVRIEFHAYPRTLEASGKSITAATVRYEYLRNGVEVPDNAPGTLSVDADIANSPVYELQRVRTQLNGMWGITGLGVLAGLIGLGFGGYIYLQNRDGSSSGVSSSDVRSAKRKLDNVRAKVDARGGSDDIIEEIDDIRDRLEDR